jgi:hypothetical protein
MMDDEGGCRRFLKNIGVHLSNYMASQARRL